MKTLMKLLKFSGWSLLILLMASLVIGGVLTGLSQEGLLHPGAGQWHVVIDGETLNQQELTELSMLGHSGAGGFLALVAAVFCLLLVLPLVLLLGVGLPLAVVLLALGGVAFALLGVAAVLAAPLLLPLLLLVWLLRRKPVPRAT